MLHQNESKLINLSLQRNQSPRDYLYEISVQYLVARAIHTCYDLGLFKLIISPITFEELYEKYPELEPAALKDLIELLASYELFSIKNGVISPTELTKLIAKKDPKYITVDESTWCTSYHIFSFLSSENFTKSISSIFSPQTSLSLVNSTLTLKGHPDALARELAHGHLVSRSLRALATSGFFEILTEDKVKFEVIKKILIEKKILKPSESVGFLSALKILHRYHIITLEIKKDLTCTIARTHLSEYLLKTHSQSIYPAMLMIDEKWWNAASKLALGLRKGTKSAFEECNHSSFYDVYLKDENFIFTQGMAAISLLENQDVADKLKSTLADYKTLIDIGGGDGGLLACFHQFYGLNKNYILFEKMSGDEKVVQTEKNKIISNMVMRYQVNLKPDIIIGDFFIEATLKYFLKYDKAAFLIKCVLHNINNENDVIKILKNIKQAMQSTSRLFIAERIVPENSGPHINRCGNFLMRMLFKADSHDVNFYNKCLSSAGFELLQTEVAGNYVVMSCQAVNRLTLSSANILSSLNIPAAAIINQLQEAPEDTRISLPTPMATLTTTIAANNTAENPSHHGLKK